MRILKRIMILLIALLSFIESFLEIKLDQYICESMITFFNLSQVKNIYRYRFKIINLINIESGILDIIYYYRNNK